LLKNNNKEKIIQSILAIILILVVILTFLNYNRGVPEQFRLYKIMDQGDYDTLLFIKTQQQGKVLAEPLLSAAIPVITNKTILASTYFNSNKMPDLLKFLTTEDCTIKAQIIKDNNIKYLILKQDFNCTNLNVSLIYQKSNRVYKIN